ncbi:hypothetical protein PTTG_03407 [Puccinia triticina 1-1 BBBD Race 1]|uniref:Mediator of RNA polymerase II transcription subunit 9 n=2 Tax=Puccinia triticina TaxID=208348 RepID=A0A180GTV4_PUCT1|nr:uncharacterized protein PtA15_7A707 [Puccinia triticina]OAV96200.1 hypothetical protein PTTG_03407 [Puccinia triticina 1-1 BBBD Race 1]WAQ86978.1 hypothetical protein PtA15_7A707 [Puccinia triticina]WAR56839.1 hypothetical protein PtB15_7B690 [Puccinia triticina]
MPVPMNAERLEEERMLLEPRLDALTLGGETGERLDQSMAISLVKQLKQLLINSLSSNGSAESRLEISSQANLLRQTVAKLERQINLLAAGDLSLLDQQELIKKLESRIQIEREILRFMGDTLPSNKETTPTASGNATADPMGSEHVQADTLPAAPTQPSQKDEVQQEDTRMEI